MEIKVTGTSQMSRSSYDLKNPNFRYTGIQPQPPAGELIMGVVMYTLYLHLIMGVVMYTLYLHLVF